MPRLIAVLAIALVGCSFLRVPGIVPDLNLGIENGTTLSVTLVVNGQHIGAFPAHSGDANIDLPELPSLPWTVEARAPSGRVLTSMQIAPGQVWSTTGPDGNNTYSGTLGRVDLSCGRLTIWAGDVPPSGPAPQPNAGAPGDCRP